MPAFSDVPIGGIVGVATIDGVLRPGTVDHAAFVANRAAVDVRWHMTERFRIVLRDARPTPFVATPGRQRWWTPPAEVVARAVAGGARR
jgi:hypothetical protein